MTTAKTKLLGLLGDPVSHSLSPRIHSAAIEACGLDAVYLAFGVPDASLERAVEGLRALGVIGFNVTVPHKRRILDRLDAVDATARAIGAVNTVIREDGRLLGTNTDAEGFVRSLERAGVPLEGRRALVVGAGGAARAAVAGLLGRGIANVDVAARDDEQADELVHDLSLLGAANAVAWEGFRASALNADLFVQATSATMNEKTANGFAASLPLDALPEHATVVDLVYAPLETSVLRSARERELQTVDGLGMLIGQAALGFERWLGVEAPIDVMRRAVSNDG